MVRLLIIVVIAVSACVALSGCMATQELYGEISRRPKFVDDYPKCVPGAYVGDVSFEGDLYRHYYFNVFPWIKSRGQDAMHLYIPTDPAKEVHAFNAQRDFGASENRLRGNGNGPPAALNYFYPNNSRIYLEPDVWKLKEHSLPDARLLIVSRSQDDDPKEIFGSVCTNVQNYRVVMTLDKAGPGTRLQIGHLIHSMVKRDGKDVLADTVTWEDSTYVVRNRPYRGSWHSGASYLGYLFTVPLDIVTAPLQAIYIGVGYWMMQGMNVR